MKDAWIMFGWDFYYRLDGSLDDGIALTGSAHDEETCLDAIEVCLFSCDAEC